MHITLDNLAIEVTQKNIKNIHLKVCPPMGDIKVSAPKRMSMKSIQLFIASKLEWIRQQQEKIRSNPHEMPKHFTHGEMHYFSGALYALNVIEKNAPPCVTLSQDEIILQIRPNTPQSRKQVIMEMWYRQQLAEKINALLPVWEKQIHVSVSKYTIKKMKTQWGSCSIHSRSIRMNLELMKKPPECLEYVLVHELVHLLEPSHNKRFAMLMDRFLPNWRILRERLK
jgi:predicted metal-dependent hydrolase